MSSKNLKPKVSKKDISDEEDLDDEQSEEDVKPKEIEQTIEPVEEDPEIKKRAKNAEKFKKYLNKTGLPLAFQVIFAEILAKKIKDENVFSYSAMRLRQIGNDILQIKSKKF